MTSLAQRYGIPMRLAHEINTKYRRFADTLVAVWTHALDAKKFGAWVASRDFSDEQAHREWEDQFELWMNYGVDDLEMGNRLVEYLTNNPGKERELRATLTSGSVGDAAGVVNRFREFRAGTTEAEDLRSQAVLELPEGSYWAQLEPDQCEAEGHLMQHCGQARGTMYSLRDARHRPHVTAEVGQEGSIRFLNQARGKQNKEPDKRYWPAVLELCKKLKISAHQSSEVNIGGIGHGDPEGELGDWLYHKLGG